MNFNYRAHDPTLTLLSAVTWFTEGLFRNNLYDLFGTGNSLHDFTG
jgi:hypothetical protein